MIKVVKADDNHVCEGCINNKMGKKIDCLEFANNMEHNGLPLCSKGYIYVEDTDGQTKEV